MSRLQKLIEELCPQGVEFKKLGEIGTFTRGNGLQKKDFTEEGFPCIHYGQIYTRYGLFTDKTISCCSPNLAANLIKAKKGDMVIACTSENMEDVCKAVVWLGEGEIVTGGHACIYSHNQNPKYIAYFFRTEQFFKQKKRYAKGVKVIDIKASDLEKIEIPVPPLAVQEEIVKILDKFTTLEAELENELRAELEARKKQYEYYRNQLLTFTPPRSENVKFVKMGEVIISLNTGLNPRKFFRLNTDDAKNYYITIREIKGGVIMPNDKTDRINDEALKLCNNRSKLEVGDVLFSGTGTIGETAIIEKKPTNWNIKEGVYSIKPKQEIITSKFLRYIMMSEDTRKRILNKVAGGTVQSIPMKELKNIIIPIPSLEEQQRIVSILDRFEALTTDLQSGLPAEIKARRQQYEYYRNKLLTFERKTA